MDVISSPNQIQEITKKLYKEGKTIGFVPTMGALHEGHLALVRKSKTVNDITIVSIFVNPKQFGRNEDLKKYPRPIGKDQALLIKEKVNYLFYPSSSAIYPSGYKTNVKVKGFSDILEGKSRPDHFAGVATVVLKLFNLINPTHAYFGQKDFQQCVVIKQMVKDLDLPVNIKIIPTVRENDGLALSSRNIFLNGQERLQALALYQSLLLANKLIAGGNKKARFIKAKMKNYLKKYKLVRLDYIEICNPQDLSAVKVIPKKVVVLITAFVGKTRLIDNIII